MGLEQIDLSATTPRTEASDEQLAARARSGCRHSFELLVRRYQVRLLRFLQRRVRGGADAEDLLQDTFVRAFEKLESYDTSRPFGVWLFTIAHRLAVSHHRHRSAGARATEAVAGRMNLAQSEDPGSALSARELRKQFWEIAASALTEEQLCVAWLFYVEEMPAPQIGQVLGKSWVSVKTILFRARRKLQVAMAPPGDAPPAMDLSLAQGLGSHQFAS